MAKTRNQSNIFEAFKGNDFDALRQSLLAFFASIPHDWYRKNQLAGYEDYYASIVYCYFTALGLDVRPEESTSRGRINLVIRFAGRIYVLEFKVNELADSGQALEQIKTRGYAEKFAGQEVYLVGAEFSSEKRNIERFEWERWKG